MSEDMNNPLQFVPTKPLRFVSTNQTSGQSCPACFETIESDEVNQTENVALCSACGQLAHTLKLLPYKQPPVDLLRKKPPQGCSLVVDKDQVVINASLSSFGDALGFGLMALFFTGGTSLLLFLNGLGLYQVFLGYLPGWLPAIQGLPSTVGEFINLSLILVPFILISIGLVLITLMYSIGAVQVVLHPARCSVKIGFGRIVRKLQFKAAQVSEVRIVSKNSKSEGADDFGIQITADSAVIEFGKYLPESNRNWLCVALKAILLQPKEAEKMLGIKMPAWLNNTELQPDRQAKFYDRSHNLE